MWFMKSGEGESNSTDFRKLQSGHKETDTAGLRN